MEIHLARASWIQSTVDRVTPLMSARPFLASFVGAATVLLICLASLSSTSAAILIIPPAVPAEVTTYIDVPNGFALPIPPGYRRASNEAADVSMFRYGADQIAIYVTDVAHQSGEVPELDPWFQSIGRPGLVKQWGNTGEIWFGGEGAFVIAFPLCDQSKSAVIIWDMVEGSPLAQEFGEYFNSFKPRPTLLHCTPLDIGTFYGEGGGPRISSGGVFPDKDAVASGWGLISSSHWARRWPDERYGSNTGSAWWSAPDVGSGRRDLLVTVPYGSFLSVDSRFSVRWMSDFSDKSPLGVTVLLTMERTEDADFEPPSSIASGPDPQTLVQWPGKWTQRGANDFEFRFEPTADKAELYDLLTYPNLQMELSRTDGAHVEIGVSHDSATQNLREAVFSQWGLSR
ncbi:hypothetical protein DMC47_01160 [Nostoc sp. 3335mG]|nr:hypothetical protein DMC47_01160 [Nostoc sp. 3335mG]